MYGNVGNYLADLEIYTPTQMLEFRVTLPIDQRLIDLFNHSGGISRSSKGDFIELQKKPSQASGGGGQGPRKDYIQKSAIQFVALSEVSLGRGFGAKGDKDRYPYVRKSPTLVNIHCPNYILIGNIHLMDGQSPQDLLNAERQFIPLTDVTICSDGKILEYRPFVAVNKLHVHWLEVDVLPKIDSAANIAREVRI